MNKKAVIVVFSFFLIYGCKEEEREIVITVPPIVTGKTGIFGKWFWIKSVGEYQPPLTPQSTGRTVVYIFNSDSTFHAEIDGFLKIRTKYSIKKEATVFFTYQEVIRYEDNSSRQHIILKSIDDTLSLADNNTAGYNYTFIRIE